MHRIGDTRAEGRKPEGGADISGLEKFKKCVSVFTVTLITNFIKEFKY